MNDVMRRTRLDAVILLVAAIAGAACTGSECRCGPTQEGRSHDRGDGHPLLGVFAGNEPREITQFEDWLGRPVDGFLGNVGMESWDDFNGSAGWFTEQWAPLDRRVFWSVPLIPWGATLAEAASGAYDAYYLKAARVLATSRPNDAELYIRTGWEFNDEQFPWQVLGHPPEEYIGAFQHFVTTFRSVSSRFKFDWTVNWGGDDKDLASYYPGDDYVDIIGMDFYWFLEWNPTDPEAAWNEKVNAQNGLQWHQDFAAAHGKPTAYAEWGIQSDNAGSYIQHVHDWFQSHPVVYQSYWNSDGDYAGALSRDQYPKAGAAYRAAFGP
jgi:hypothetical protein